MNLPRLRILPLLTLLIITSLLACSQSSSDNGDSEDQDGSAQPATFILVRHAEKGPGADPELTPEGQRRAQRLADRLASQPVRAVYAFQYDQNAIHGGADGLSNTAYRSPRMTPAGSVGFRRPADRKT